MNTYKVEFTGVSFIQAHSTNEVWEHFDEIMGEIADSWEFEVSE